ncbi:hypothetical protein ACN47E_009959 [Coniothyrium glycines]
MSYQAVSDWSTALPWLRAESSILENSLADCVTYLNALRTKLTREKRRLSCNSTMTRKKRKKMQHCIYEITKDIMVRERAEQALLNNLQACQAKIFLVSTLWYPSLTQLSTVLDTTSGSTHCSVPEESEPTEESWNGWAEEATMSPFQKQSTASFFESGVAPDECSQAYTQGCKKDRKLPPIIIRTGEVLDGPLLPAPPNTAASQHIHSVLSPEAAVFEPYGHSVHVRKDSVVSSGPEGEATVLPMFRSVDGGVAPGFQQIPLRSRYVSEGRHSHTWCSPDADRRGKYGTELSRVRNNSL